MAQPNIHGDNVQNPVAIDINPSLRSPAGVPNGLHRGMDPPSYEEVVNQTNTPPPSYESLFGRVKEARKSSKGVFDFFTNVLILILGTSKFKMNEKIYRGIIFFISKFFLLSWMQYYSRRNDSHPNRNDCNWVIIHVPVSTRRIYTCVFNSWR